MRASPHQPTDIIQAVVQAPLVADTWRKSKIKPLLRIVLNFEAKF